MVLAWCTWVGFYDAPLFGLVWLTLLLVGPWGAALGCAGADAVGCISVVLVGRRGVFGVAVCCVCHLAGGLCVLSARLLGGRGLSYRGWLVAAGLLEVVAARASGLVTHPTFPTEWQWRYLLPALLVLAHKNRADAVTPAPSPHGGSREYVSV
jgi:hypothetical protein